MTDEQVVEALERVGLQHLVPMAQLEEAAPAESGSEVAGLVAVPADDPTRRAWPLASTLSPGQQQQLQMARLLRHPPTFAALDEATSALDDATAERMYQLCLAAGVTLVSVLHRTALVRLHTRVLTLGAGQWRLEQVSV